MQNILSSPSGHAVALLPTLYMVWADAVLSPAELGALQHFIHKTPWLTKNDRQLLEAKLSFNAPPGREEMEEWRVKIMESMDEETEFSGLADIGVYLIQNLSSIRLSEEEKKAVKNDLLDLEQDLGIIGKSAIYLFKSKHPTVTTGYRTEEAFDVRQLTAILDGSQQPLVKEIKKLLCDPVFDYMDPSDITAYRNKVLEWCKILAGKGYGATGYPGEFGGSNDMEGYFTIMETLSYRDLSMVIKFGVQFGLWGMSILSLGTEKHHRKYLKDIGTLKLPGCFAMTETNHGSNVKGIETTASYNHSEQTFTIHTPHAEARKEYIGNAAMHGRMATVFAKLIIEGKDYGVNAFVVPLRDEAGNTLTGVTIEDCGRKMGLNGVDNGLIAFDQVIIPRENMLDRFAGINDNGEFKSPIASDNKRFFTMLGTLVGGRIGIPRSALAACKSGLTIAIRYGDQRKQFGPEGGAEVPILNYRIHQRRLIPLLAKTYACHFSLQYVTERFLNRKEEDMQEIEALAAAIKSYVTWHTTAALQECREACGGKGYLSENRIDNLKNDTDIYTTFEGDNTVLLQLVAKSRLSAYKEQFENMNLFRIINYVASRTKTSLTEKNPLIVRNVDEKHLLDPEFHMNAFEYREIDILDSVAKRLKRLIGEGMDPFDAMNVCQHHLIAVGEAYIERVILEKFIEKVNQTENEAIRSILKKLCDLYALYQLETHKGWYLEQGYMDGIKTKAIRKMVNQLCWEIRKDAVPLVNAFDIPDACLAAPIAITS